jgi:hypothetical protein
MRAIVLSPVNNCIEVVYLDEVTAKSLKKIEGEIEYCAGCNISEVSYMLCEDDDEIPVFQNGSDKPIAYI